MTSLVQSTFEILKASVPSALAYLACNITIEPFWELGLALALLNRLALVYLLFNARVSCQYVERFCKFVPRSRASRSPRTWPWGPGSAAPDPAHMCVCTCAWCCVCVCSMVLCAGVWGVCVGVCIHTCTHTHTFQSRVSVLEFRILA